MDAFYQKITEYMVESGTRLREKAGSMKDIGVGKKYLTEEDLRIERELE